MLLTSALSPSATAPLALFAVLVMPAAAQDCWRPDVYDGLPDAPLITPGTYDRLTLRRDFTRPEAVRDEFRIVLPPQSRLVLDIEATSPFAPPQDSGVFGPTTTAEPFFLGSIDGMVGASPHQPFRIYPPGVPQPSSAHALFGLEPLYENETDAPLEATILVGANALELFGCVEYTLTATIVPRPCVAMSDDALEGPDDCATATVLTPGLHTDLVVFDAHVPDGADADAFRIPNVLPGERVVLTLDPHTPLTNPPIHLELLPTEQNCGASGGTIRTRTWFNASAAPIDLYAYVDTWRPNQAGSEADGCEVYDLHLARVPSACGSIGPDALEPNAPCAQPAVVTAGTYTDLSIDGADDDLYEIVVPAQTELHVQLDDRTPHARPRLALHEATDCDPSAPVDTDEGFWPNTTAAPVTLQLQVASERGECFRYDMELTLLSTDCNTPFADPLEPNDSCASAKELVEGEQGISYDFGNRPLLASADLRLEPGDVDHVAVVVRPHDTYVALAVSSVALDPISVEALPADDCSAAPVPAKVLEDSSSFGQFVILANRTDAHRRFVVRVEAATGVTECVRYRFGYYRSRPCKGFEDVSPRFAQHHSDCASAVTVPESEVGRQTLFPGRPKYVRAFVPAGRRLRATASVHSFFGSGTEVELRLHDGDADCITGGATLGSATLGALEQEASADFDNQGASEREVLIEVALAENALDCMQVMLEVDLEQHPEYEVDCLGHVVSGYGCPCGNDYASRDGGGCENSTGVGARLAATGTADVSVDDFRLEISDMAPGASGLVLRESGGAFTYHQQAFYDGQLCLGGQDAPQVLRSFVADTTGAWQFGIPLAGALGVTPGTEDDLQVWYRDFGGPCGAGSNSTNVVRVEWR